MIYKVVWQFQLAGGQGAQNVWHVALDGVGTEEANAEAYLEWLATVMWPVLDFIVSQLARLIAIELWQLVDSEYQQVAVRVVNQAGTATGDPVPPAVALLVQQKVSGGGKNGSKYLPGLNEPSWLGSVWNSTAVSVAAAFMLPMSTPQEVTVGGVTIDFNHGVARQPIPGGAIGFVPFSGDIVVDLEPGSQRRRRRGVGM